MGIAGGRFNTGLELKRVIAEEAAGWCRTKEGGRQKNQTAQLQSNTVHSTGRGKMYTQFRKVTWWLVAYKCVGSRIYEVLCSAVQVTTPPKLNEATHYQLSSVTFDAATIKIIAVDNIIIFIFIL